MNLLALVNRTRIECGSSAVKLTTLANALSSEDQRIYNWVTEAWHDIQTAKNDWLWMKKPFAFPSVGNQQRYDLGTVAGTTLVADVAEWKRDSFRLYTTAIAYADETSLFWTPEDDFRNFYRFGAQRAVTGRPTDFTILQARSIALGVVPADASYTIAGDYYHLPTDLVVDTDDPSATGNDLPARFHMLIVWMAMQSYASYEAAPEVLQRGQVEAKRLMWQLEFAEMPEIGFGPPLA
jgi:hypothetical protein